MAAELVAATETVKSRGRRTISPYDLSHGDNPGTVISRPALRGPNYDEWSASIRLALRARKKFGFADGSIPKPSEDSDDYEDWCANNALVVSWIKLTIDESLCSTLSHSDEASSLWTQIQKRFAMKNGQRVQRLKTELANCRQQGTPIETYFGKLTKLWTSLADYQQAKTMEDIAREREEDKLHQFLMGIDDSLYGAVKSSLLSRTPLPSLDEAYNVLVQDEESKSLAKLHEDKSPGVSFAVQTQARPRQSVDTRGGSLVCTLCGKNGHLADNCFKKIGYPAWWGERTRNKPSFSSGASSGSSGARPKSNVARANHVTAEASHANSAITSADRVGFSGLNDTQWKTLVNMLNVNVHLQAFTLQDCICP